MHADQGNADAVCGGYASTFAAALPMQMEQCTGNASYAIPFANGMLRQGRWSPWSSERDGGLARLVDRLRNKTIAVVASSGNLRYRRHGAAIDSHDVIVRMNNAKTSGFEEDVGSRTDLRVTWKDPTFDVLRDLTFTNNEILIGRKFDDWSELLWDSPSVQEAIAERNVGLGLLDAGWLRCLHFAILRSGGYEPSTGFDALAVAVAINSAIAREDGVAPQPVSVYGFGACRPCVHYYGCNYGNRDEATGQRGNHPFDIEKQLRQAWHREGLIRLTEQSCDAGPLSAGFDQAARLGYYARPPSIPPAPPLTPPSPKTPPRMPGPCEPWCDTAASPRQCAWTNYCSSCAECVPPPAPPPPPASPPMPPPPSPPPSPLPLPPPWLPPTVPPPLLPPIALQLALGSAASIALGLAIGVSAARRRIHEARHRRAQNFSATDEGEDDEDGDEGEDEGEFVPAAAGHAAAGETRSVARLGSRARAFGACSDAASHVQRALAVGKSSAYDQQQDEVEMRVPEEQQDGLCGA